MNRLSIQNATATLTSLLPYFGQEKNFITGKDLPASFKLDVEYIKQEQKYSCGIACARMILSFFNIKDKSENQILEELNIRNHNDIVHSSYEEIIGQWLLSYGGVLPALYSPAGHINPILKDGVVATDFIRSNHEIISNHDFKVFQNILVETKCPALVRIHFTTDIYPMKQDEAKYMDVSGHALLMVGYDEEGFIFNDPWDNDKWGGQRGGKNIKISYKDLKKGHNILVNCSKEVIEPFTKLEAYFEHLPVATHKNRNAILELVINWSGIPNLYLSRWFIDEVTLNLKSCGTLKFENDTFNFKTLLKPGSEIRLNIPMNTGNELGSSEIEFEIIAIVKSPIFKWIIGDKTTIDEARINTKYRVSVQSDDFFKNYGIVDMD